MKIFVFGLRGFPNIQGGVEIHSGFLYPKLAREEIYFTIFRRNPFLNEVSKKATFSKIKFIDLPSTRINGIEAFLHSFLCSFVSILKRPDIVHVHNIGPGFYTPLLKLFRLKVVLTYHSPNYEHKKWNLFGKILLRLSETLSLQFADKVIFVSEKQRNKFPNLGDKSVCISNGVLAPNLSIENETLYLKKHHIQTCGYILNVGRITPEKGTDVIIQAYKKLKTREKLVIAGAADNKSNYFDKIKKMSNGSPQIVFTGFVSGDELNCLYKNAQLFVLPSHNEGHSIVILEAMSYGLNILASDIVANREMNLPEESYFPDGDVDTLANLLNMKIQESPKFQHYNMNKYTWDNIAQQTYEIYQEVLR